MDGPATKNTNFDVLLCEAAASFRELRRRICRALEEP
jgi:hypothetical protein